jgi:hypothetical protein
MWHWPKWSKKHKSCNNDQNPVWYFIKKSHYDLLILSYLTPIHTPNPMRFLQHLPDPVHDIFAHFVILSKLTLDANIEGILKI